jgi:hypothetical protein
MLLRMPCVAQQANIGCAIIASRAVHGGSARWQCTIGHCCAMNVLVCVALYLGFNEQGAHAAASLLCYKIGLCMWPKCT